MKTESLDYSDEKLLKMFAGPGDYFFTASSCGTCRKTANVIGGVSGWFCECGAFNALPWDNNFIPHEHPDMGPTRQRIVNAAQAVRA